MLIVWMAAKKHQSIDLNSVFSKNGLNNFLKVTMNKCIISDVLALLTHTLASSRVPC